MAKVALYKRLLVANVVAILTVLSYVASLAIPASEATRIRNAFLIETVTQKEIDWTPAQLPPGFISVTFPPTPLYADVVNQLRLDSLGGDWPKALVLASHLTEHAHDLGPIQSDLDTAYHAIVEHGRGYCADFTQVYLGLARAAGLFAREWGFSLDGFGGYGHAFVEVFDRQRDRWVWIDVYNNVHAVDRTTRDPLSAAEFRSYARGERGNVDVVRNGPGRLGYVHTEKLVDYYRRGSSAWYLWAGNAVFRYERSLSVRMGGKLGRGMEQLAAIAQGVHPKIYVVPDQGNQVQIQRMVNLRRVIASVAVVLVVLSTSLVWLGIGLLRLRRRPGRVASISYT